MEPLANCPRGNAPQLYDDRTGPRVNVYCSCGCQVSVWAPREHAATAWNATVAAVQSAGREATS